MNAKLLNSIVDARRNILLESFSPDMANSKLENEIKLLTNANPSNTTVPVNAGDLVPDVVQLSTYVDNIVKGKAKFMEVLDGRQTLIWTNNQYPVIGDVIAAGSGSERTTGGIHDGKEATEALEATRITINTAPIYAAYGISRQLLNMSLIDIVSIANRNLTQQVVLNIAQSVINGDTDTTTSNINTFGALPTAVLPKWAKNATLSRDNGLRKVCLSGVEWVSKVNVGWTINITDIIDATSLLDDGWDLEDYIVVTDRKTFNAIQKTEDFLDKSRNGQTSPIHQSANANIYGMDIFVTSLLPRTNASGVVDGVTPANNIKWSILVMRKNVIQHGYLGNVIYNTIVDPIKWVLIEVAGDFGFENISQLQGRNDSVLLYNIDA